MVVFPVCIGDCLISKVIYLSLVSEKKKKKRAVKKMSELTLRVANYLKGVGKMALYWGRNAPVIRN